MCWHCGSRWESQHWLMVQWAPRGVFISLKIHKAAVTNRPLMLQSRICSETSFREIREKSRRNALAAYSFTWSAVSVTISWVVGDERRSKTKKITLEPVVLDSGVLKGLFTQNVLLFTHRAITTIDNNIWPNCLQYLMSLFCFLLGWQKVIKVNLRSMCSLYIYISGSPFVFSGKNTTEVWNDTKVKQNFYFWCNFPLILHNILLYWYLKYTRVQV